MKTLIAVLIVAFSLPAVAQERKAENVTKAAKKTAEKSKGAKKADKKAADQKKAADKGGVKPLSPAQQKNSNQ